MADRKAIEAAKKRQKDGTWTEEDKELLGFKGDKTEVGKNRSGAEKAEIEGPAQATGKIAKTANDNKITPEVKTAVDNSIKGAKAKKMDEQAYDKAQLEKDATAQSVDKAAKTSLAKPVDEKAAEYDAQQAQQAQQAQPAQPAMDEVAAASGTDQDGNVTSTVVDDPDATEEEKETVAERAKGYLESSINGLVNEDGTLNSNALMDYTAKAYHEPSTLLKVLNVIGGLIHAATLGIVPRVDFMKITGQTDLLNRLNGQVDEYNSFLKDRAKSYNDTTLDVAANADKIKTEFAANKENAASVDDTDIENAGRYGKFLTNLSGYSEQLAQKFQNDKEMASLQHEYEMDAKAFDAKIAKEMSSLSAANQQALLKLTQSLQNRAPVEQAEAWMEMAEDPGFDDKTFKKVCKMQAMAAASRAGSTPMQQAAKTANDWVGVGANAANATANVVDAVRGGKD